jgi:beta-lactamase class A
LNEAALGDPRDTTTPAAMADLIHTLVLGPALSASSRDQLAAWLVANKTGDKRLRARMPKEWRVGDKTGSGANNTVNDIAVVWPPGGPPIVVAAYYTGATASEEERNAVLAEVGRIAAAI